jgi:DHA1 family inner membrane transport protein
LLASALRLEPGRRGVSEATPQAPSLRSSGRLAALAVVGAMYFTIGVGLDMILALLPAMAAAFAVGSASIVWITTARASSRFVSPVIGRLSDRFGRKAIVLPGLAVFALGNLGSAAVTDFTWLIATQALAGLGLTAMQVSLPAYLGDLFPYQIRGRAIGAATICAASGTMLGVPAGALLAQALGVRAAFLVLGLLIGALVPLALVYMASVAPAATPPGETPPAPAAWHAPLRHGRVRAALVTTLCWLAMSAALYTFLAAWLEEALAFTISQIGWAFSLMGGASVLANLLVTSFSDRLGKQRAVLLGLLLGIACVLPLGRATQTAPTLAMICLFILTTEFAFGAYIALLTELIPAQRGMVMSLNLVTWGIGVTLSPLLAGLLWRSGGFQAVTYYMAAMGLAALSISYFFMARPASTSLQPAQPTL